MAKTNKIIYVTQAQYVSLITDGYVVVDGVTYNYDANNTYMVQENGLEGTNVQSTGVTSGKVLTANGSGGSSWQTVSAGAPEGTAVKSTGVTSGKVLTANGSGGASWQTAGGGGSGDVTASGTLSVGAVILGLGNKTVSSSSGTNGKFLAWQGGATWKGLYNHCIGLGYAGDDQVGEITAIFNVISSDATAYTSMDAIPDGKYVASGDADDLYDSHVHCRVVYVNTDSNEIGYWVEQNLSISSATPEFSESISINDTVNQIY